MEGVRVCVRGMARGENFKGSADERCTPLMAASSTSGAVVGVGAERVLKGGSVHRLQLSIQDTRSTIIALHL